MVLLWLGVQCSAHFDVVVFVTCLIKLSFLVAIPCPLLVVRWRVHKGGRNSSLGKTSEKMAFCSPMAEASYL
jgi:hypothetical protein